MVNITGQLDAPLLDVGTVKQDYWERKEILLPSLSRLFKPKGWKRFFYKTQAPKIVLKRLTQTDWDEIDNRNFLLQGELAQEGERCKPLINKFANGEILNESDAHQVNEYAMKMRPITYNMLQFMIDEPKMSYDDIAMMMDIMDQFDTDTLLSYVSIMTSEKARAMKLIYDKRMKESEMITQ
tara:strand:- start:1210 stop:1755 length:546 start_codon:yes stop_codon:yes gene_type:complete